MQALTYIDAITRLHPHQPGGQNNSPRFQAKAGVTFFTLLRIETMEKKNRSGSKYARLYERLVNVRLPDNMPTVDVVAAYLAATMVAAGISVDYDFANDILLQLAEKSAEQQLQGVK